LNLVLAIALAAAPISHPLNEDQASKLVFKALPQLYPNESVRCFSVMTEERSRAAFDFAVREIHNRRCVGDPGVMPVRDRFRVGRSPARLWIYDLFNDKYRPCQLSATKPPKCVRPE